jgi:hypothetical protein
MIPRVPLRQALSDSALLGGILDGESWLAWRTLLVASMGEELTADERTLFKQFTQRDHEPLERVEEFVAIKGRRGGGSRSASVIAAYLAGLCQYPRLARGERGVCLCVAADQRQADVILDYTEANFRNSPVLAQLIQSRAQRELRLNNGIDVEVRASDFRRLRGLTFIACVADEMAFWQTDDSANPDTEILAAIRPGLATTSGPLFLISSPYARRGELWKTFSKHYGPNGDPSILVCKGTSREFNPSLPQSVVDRAFERDAASASAEYGANFRTDVESFVSLEAIRQCVVGFIEKAPATSHVTNYVAFADPSGGSVDSFAMAIGHFDYARSTVVLDCLREIVAPFNPEQATQELSRTLKSYHLNKVTGDKYAGAYPVEQFARFGIQFEQSAKPKSDLYIDLLPLLNSRRIELLDHPKLCTQLVSLERKTTRGGKDSIDHPPGGKDDLANACAGLASICVQAPTFDYAAFNGTAGGDTNASDYQRWRYNIYLESHGLVRI